VRPLIRILTVLIFLLALLGLSFTLGWHLSTSGSSMAILLSLAVSVTIGAVALLCWMQLDGRFRDSQSSELALERRVEERTRALQQEIADRVRAEQLNRGQKHVLEMLADPGDLTTEDILQSLADVVASRNQGWESSIFLFERRGRKMQRAASSGVHERMQSYLKLVGTEFADTPECQASLSGEVHIVEHLSQVDLPWSRQLVDCGIFSVWSLPFCDTSSGRLTGVLTIYSRARSGPSELEMEMGESAARLAALVVEHRRIRTELLHSAYRDPVTGLPNLRAGEQALEEAVEQAQSAGAELAVLWIDLDRFRRINSHFGRAIADETLCAVAERLRRHPLTAGTVARMGEDEFMILAPGPAGTIDGFEIARQLSRVFAEPVELGAARIDAALSIGACMFPQDGTSAQILLRNAEFAMRHARESGKSFCAFSAALNAEASERLEIEDALGPALENNWLRLVYQPLYAADGQLIALEALLRFHHPRLGEIPPSRFIPIAEQTRQIVPIGNWVLRESCQQLRKWLDDGLPRVQMNVNISALQFARDDFSDRVASVLEEFRLDPRLLTIELTESVVMDDDATARRQMNLLRQCGIHIAMDDFGTGYSSLSYLHRIPVDVLKIDRSFIDQLEAPEGTRPIVEAVISLAQRLSLTVVAEGVETEAQHAILDKAGCHEYQGYLFARPMNAADAGRCLRASRVHRFAKASDDVDGAAAIA